ncbi:LolA-like protein [Tautonia sociabilis]|uniref:Uncharacterized protein n=1 Tax=Tautonia sociabilis TaxID=2080755 RepID=A0A432MLE7_9BACT|nr:hypothetical protein [Tautonia sociabilis]RUL88243.1 hypothetical protein TsocGM_07855 [Tautonia sociabilis]
MHAILIALAACGQSPELDADPFLRVIRGLHDDIADVSLVYEAVIEVRGPGQSADRDEIQGTYVYRSDGASVIDSFTHSSAAGAAFTHRRYALLEGRLEETYDSPDLMGVPLPVITGSGSGGVLNMPGSPHRILYLWYFAPSENLTMEGFENLGWEEIDGHRCLHVRLQRHPGSRTTSISFWIDLERGGHPLRMEMHDDGKLLSRVDQIRLNSFNVNGTEYWLPVHGVQETYWDGKTYHDEPTVRETYDVVRSSVRFNQNPPDHIFTAEGAPKKPADPGLRALDDDFQRQVAQAKSAPMPRTDPDSVQENLDRRLAEAERQAEMVEASSAARRVWGPGRLSRIGLAVFGIVAIGVALTLAIRRSV